VELLDGWILDKMPHNPPHDGAVTRLDRRLNRLLGDDWLVRCQCAVTLPRSEPEPDVVVVPGPESAYDRRHPSSDEIALLVEVADTTLQRDREMKGGLYAAARVPVYWIVNLPERCVEVYTRPRGGRTPAYRQRDVYGLEDTIPLVVAGTEIARLPVRELLP
jgi:Uma2 family endonuclease